MAAKNVVKRMDEAVDDFCKRVRLFNEPMTKGRARTFVRQHRQNTRHRNSVLKLRVATNCPIWDLRMKIIGACSEELIADHEYGGGKPHWKILEELGESIGMSKKDIQTAPLLASTQLSWNAWEGLMTTKHWLEGLVANTCAERANVPGYGKGEFRKKGWFGVERERWRKLFKLDEEQLVFFKLHSEADVVHSNLGWHAVAKYAEEYAMEDAAVEACRVNLVVWENYLNGIADGGDQRGA